MSLTFFGCDDLTILKNVGQIFCKISLYWDLWYFIISRWSCGFWYTTEEKGHFHHFITITCYWYDFHCWQFLYMGLCVLSAIYVYIYFYECRHIGIYYILWSIIQYHFTFFCSNCSCFGHWGLFQLAVCFWYIFCLFVWLLWQLITFWNSRWSWFILCNPYLSSRIINFLKNNLVPFSGITHEHLGVVRCGFSWPSQQT